MFPCGLLGGWVGPYSPRVLRQSRVRFMSVGAACTCSLGDSHAVQAFSAVHVCGDSRVVHDQLLASVKVRAHVSCTFSVHVFADMSLDFQLL